MSPKKANFVLCHELSHLRQYQEGKLIQLNDTKVIYDGVVINLLITPYDERKYEIEADYESFKLYKIVKNLF